MITIDGHQLAQEKLKEVAQRVRKLRKLPSLAVVLVGGDKASHLYVKLKQKAAKEAGIEFHKYLLDKDAAQEEVLECIDFLRGDEDVSGIIVQLPLPAQIDTDACIEAIGSAKDVDGFHKDNIAQFVADNTGDFAQNPIPVFPLAMVLLALAAVGETGEAADEILCGKRQSVLAGKRAVIVVRSELFGSVMAAAVKRIGLEPSVVFCTNLKCAQAQVLSGDVVFTACGEANLIDEKFVKKGAIVIDGGIVKHGNKTVGDVDVASVSDKVAALTLVPGGVGPMTVACLLENVTHVCEQ